MKDGFRQSMAWLHTWAGLSCGWVLCAVFFTGSLSVFREPITRWMEARPLLADTAASAPAPALDRAVAHLSALAPQSRLWRIDLPARPGDALRLGWRNGRVADDRAMHPATGELLPAPWGRKTEGGRHFMTFHYTLHGGIPGYWLVGWVSACALVALLSGVVVHRRIFADFFTFRRGRGQRSWLDAHNATAVFTLPFLFVIVYTGLAYFYSSYMPWPVQAAYGTQKAYERYQQELSHAEAPPPAVVAAPRRPAPAPADAPAAAPLLPLAPLLAAATERLGRAPHLLLIERPADRPTVVRALLLPDIGAPSEGLLNLRGSVAFDGATGAVLRLQRPGPPPGFSSERIHQVMEALHVASFGGWPVKWLYFGSGLLGTAMVATGCCLFMVKRRQRAEAEFGAATVGIYRVIEALNVACLAGIGLASIGYLYANRLLPADMAGRERVEITVFLLAWAASLVHALARPVGRAWNEQFAATAALCLALPLLNQLTVGQQFWRYAVAGDGQRAGVELTVVAMGLVAAWLAWRVRVGRPSGRSARPQPVPGHRMSVASRLAAASLGGYALAALAASVAALALPRLTDAGRADGVMVASLSSFAVYAALALWVFHARSARRAWAGLGAGAAVAVVLLGLLKWLP
ncbi:PepSY domain-containing protein [Xylophilus sp. Kf1]|nr:PepSY domain-containing protein [Xylophilus sp. Kf1]